MRNGRFTILEEDPRRRSSDCGDDCEAESKPHGTATLLRCTLSAVEKSLLQKYLLHKYLLRSMLSESVVQDIQTFLAHTTAM
jgi:hypothetical protein